MRVGDFVRRDDPRAAGGEGVEPLAGEPVEEGVELALAPILQPRVEAPLGDVVEDGVAEDVVVGLSGRDVLPSPADDDRQLRLPPDRYVVMFDDYLLTVSRDAGRGLEEELLCDNVGLSRGGVTAFGDVLAVIPGETDDLAGPLDGRAELHPIQAVALGRQSAPAVIERRHLVEPYTQVLE